MEGVWFGKGREESTSYKKYFRKGIESELKTSCRSSKVGVGENSLKMKGPKKEIKLCPNFISLIHWIRT